MLISCLVHLEEFETARLKFSRIPDWQSQTSSFLNNRLWSGQCLQQKMAAVSDLDKKAHPDHPRLVTREFVAYFPWNKETWHIRQTETCSISFPELLSVIILEGSTAIWGWKNNISVTVTVSGGGWWWKHGKINRSLQWLTMIFLQYTWINNPLLDYCSQIGLHYFSL